MFIGVGSHRYDVKIAEDRLFLNKKPVLAICDHHENHVLIAACIVGTSLMQDVLAESLSMIMAYHSQADISLSDPLRNRSKSGLNAA